jgi:hypothetical protein
MRRPAVVVQGADTPTARPATQPNVATQVCVFTAARCVLTRCVFTVARCVFTAARCVLTAARCV